MSQESRFHILSTCSYNFIFIILLPIFVPSWRQNTLPRNVVEDCRCRDLRKMSFFPMQVHKLMLLLTLTTQNGIYFLKWNLVFLEMKKALFGNRISLALPVPLNISSFYDLKIFKTSEFVSSHLLNMHTLPTYGFIFDKK